MKEVKHPKDRYQRLIKEFAEVINRNSLEEGSNTPDYVLAKMLVDTLAIYNEIVQTKEQWHKHIIKERG